MENKEDSDLVWPVKHVHKPQQLIAIVNEVSSGFDEHEAAVLRRLIEVFPIAILGVHNRNSISEEGVVTFDPVEPVLVFREMNERIIESWVFSNLCSDKRPVNKTFSVVFVEPGVTFTEPVNAWLCKGMRLSRFEAPDVVRELRTNKAKSQQECRLTFTPSAVLRGTVAMALARQKLEQIAHASINPYERNE